MNRHVPTIDAADTGGGPALADGNFFGVSLASLGDLNGDGIDDLAVGAQNDDTGGSFRGAVYVLFLNDGTVEPPSPMIIDDGDAG